MAKAHGKSQDRELDLLAPSVLHRSGVVVIRSAIDSDNTNHYDPHSRNQEREVELAEQTHELKHSVSYERIRLDYFWLWLNDTLLDAEGFDDLAHNRADSRPTATAPFDYGRYGNRGIFVRSKGHHPSVVVSARHLRSAGLGRDCNAVNPRSTTGAGVAGHHSQHGLFHDVKGPPRNAFNALARRGVAADVGRDQIAAVGNGGHVAGHLHRRDQYGTLTNREVE